MRIRRAHIATVALLRVLVGCGEDDASSTGAPATPPAIAPPPLAGTYDVNGLTVDQATGSERNVAGSVVIDTGGGTYTASFHLATTLVQRGESQRAEIVGTGSGKVVGRTLTGSAETQMIVALVPGVDAGFGMLPQGVTTRIVNRTTAVISREGALRIEILSDPAPGARYSPTRTTLRGRRSAELAAKDPL